MSERASWGAVPHAVVSKVLWSDDLGLLDRLRCQKVCQTWKSLLGEPPSALERSDLSTDLCIEFDQSTTGRQHISLHLEEDPAAIRVLTHEDPVAWPQGRVPGFHACCQWLTLHAPLIRKIQLSKAIMCSPVLVRQLVQALTGASPQTPPAIAITTPSAAGPALLEACEDVLVKTLVALHFESTLPLRKLGAVAKMTHLTSLTLARNSTGRSGRLPNMPFVNKLTLLQIQKLANLHTLSVDGVKGSDLDLQWLQSLRRLCLGTCYTNTCDLTSCTQLTSLDVTWVSDNRNQHLLLPAGSTVQLQHLSVSATFHPNGHRFQEVKNLRDAIKLTALQFDKTHPVDLDQGDWPMSMPQLNTIKANRMRDWAVLRLVGYSQLRHLDCQLMSVVGCLVEVPHEFSQLTQLETLRLLAFPGLTVFPACLLHLKQLSSLDIGYGMHNVGLDDEILQFSECIALTRLHFRTSDLWPWEANKCLYSMRALEQLMRLRSLLEPKVLFSHSYSST